VSTLLHATVHVILHNLLNVLVHIANKMELHKNVQRCLLLGNRFAERNNGELGSSVHYEVRTIAM
jgi:hypothetical protein